MKTGKKIAVGLAAALAIAMFAAGAVSMVGAIPVPVTMVANVVDGTDVSVEYGEAQGNFGEIIKGTPATLINALILTNNGPVEAKVEVRFLSSHDGVYGLVIEGTSVIPASTFTVGTTGNGVALADDGAPVDLTVVNNVPSNGETQYDTTIAAEGTQSTELGSHIGVGEIIISAA